MLYRILFAALIAMSASVTSAAPVLDAGDALEARMAKLEATVNELEFEDKVKKLAEEHGIKEQDLKEQWGSRTLTPHPGCRPLPPPNTRQQCIGQCHDAVRCATTRRPRGEFQACTESCYDCTGRTAEWSQWCA